MLHPPAETVNHHWLGAGEVSTGDLGNLRPALTEMRKTAPMEPLWSTISAGQKVKKEILAEQSLWPCIGKREDI
jgi:hypothetical protein